MYKINQSLAERMSQNKSVVVIAPVPVIPVKEAEEEELIEPGVPAIDPQEQAQRIIDDAKKQAEKIKKSAEQDGYREGKAKGERELAELLKNETEKARIVFSELEKYKQGLYSELQDIVLQLSFDIAEKIVNRSLQKDDKTYIGIVKKAILELKGSDKFVMRVGKEEYERFFKNGSHWLQEETGCAPFDIVCDMQLGEGGCILESNDAVINASTKMQLGRIKHQLEEKAEQDARVH